MNDHFFAPERWTEAEFLIRSYLPGDGPLVAEALNNSYAHLRTFMPWAKPQTTEAEAERTARRFRARYLRNEEFVLGVFAVDARRLLGGTGFHLREGGLDNRSAEIGMWIRADAAGQGLGTRALCAMLTWGFRAWPWERLAWRCSARNLASRRTAEKAGMQQEGRLRAHRRLPDGTRDDTLCFAALKGSWENPLAGA